MPSAVLVAILCLRAISGASDPTPQTTSPASCEAAGVHQYLPERHSVAVMI